MSALIFALYSAVLTKSLGSPVHPRFDRSSSNLRLWQQILEAGWCVLGTHVTVGLGRLAFKIDRWPEELRLLPDILSGIAYLIGSLAVIDLVFAIPVRALVATSGVLAIIIGLALQNTLGDVFSGIAVRVERPYEVGDLVCVDTLVEGTVAQINWRSTHFRTDANDIAVVPNSVIAKSRVINRTSSPMCRDRLTVAFDGGVVPDVVAVVLQNAVLLCPTIQENPKAEVRCTTVSGDRNTFVIDFSTGSHELLQSTRDKLCREIYRHARFAAVALAGAGASQQPETVRLQDAIACVAELRALGEGERRHIAATMQRYDVGTGSSLRSRGVAEESLSVVMAGVLEMMSARAGPGDVVTADAVALADSVVWSISRYHLVSIINGSDGARGPGVA